MEGKGATEDATVGWHHRFNAHELAQTPGDSEGQGSLVCCSPWGHKELDMTLRLNNKDILKIFTYLIVMGLSCSTWDL